MVEQKKEREGRPKFNTAPYDPRFPNTNQTRNCFQNYLEHKRCEKKRGSDFEACKYFERISKILCPSTWIEKWDAQVAEGVFPSKI